MELVPQLDWLTNLVPAPPCVLPWPACLPCKLWLYCSLPACLPTCLLAYVSSCLPSCLPAYLSSCLPSCMPCKLSLYCSLGGLDRVPLPRGQHVCPGQARSEGEQGKPSDSRPRYAGCSRQYRGYSSNLPTVRENNYKAKPLRTILYRGIRGAAEQARA